MIDWPGPLNKFDWCCETFLENGNVRQIGRSVPNERTYKTVLVRWLTSLGRCDVADS